MIQIRDFTVPELDKFRELCNFTPQERLYYMYNTPLNKLLKIKLNKAHCQYVKQIVSALVQAFDEIEIEIYNEE